ncbi:MAG: hypothetical protein HY698_01660 [Deltaproteobacteria bacterium]|nr:hypothetical protein [Deltaproteobacteria bacterium]
MCMKLVVEPPTVAIRFLSFGAFFAAWFSCLASARADHVLAERTSWNEARNFIYTELTIERDDGRVETIRIPGGVVGDVGMVQFDLRVGGMPVGWDPVLVNYVRTRTKSGTPLRWAKSCVHVTPDEPGTTDIEGTREFEVVQQVLSHWETATMACSYLNFVLKEPSPGEVGFDGVNRIKFRENTWCRPATSKKPEECYDSQAAAITTLFFRDKPGASDDGIVLDADIEMNAVHFAVAVNGQTLGQGDGISDLANTLAHEVGHLVGLDHTCWDGNGTRPTDHKGVAVPSCFPVDALPAEVKDATMYNFAESAETKKATLEKDDIAGFCGIYPIASDPGKCEPALDDNSGWCNVTGAPRAGATSRALGWRWALLGLAVPLCFRRRRGRREES